MRGPLRPRGGVAMAMVLLSACATSVSVALPPARTAPLAQRYSFYQDHQPRSLAATTYTEFGMYGSVRQRTTLDSLRLANGLVIERAEDLLPLVPPESRAAQRMRDVVSYRDHSTRAGYVALGMAGVSAGLILLGGLRPSPVGDADGAMLFTGVGLAFGAVISTVVYALLGTSSMGARQDALLGFDPALRERLNLCENEQGIFDCDAPPPPPAAPPPPPAAPLSFPPPPPGATP
jgi:hypothetical protein